MKHRACYNCAHYEDRGIDQLPIGSRPEDKSGAEIRTTDFAPRCLKGLNPSLAHAPKFMGERMQNTFEPDAMAAFCDTYIWAPPAAGDKFRKMVRKKVEMIGPSYSTVNLPLKFVKFWEKGPNVRLKVEQGTNFIHTEMGYVAMSTGWVPVFLLVRSTKAKGSSVILSDDDRIVGIRDWQKGGGYKKYRDIS